MLGIIIDNNNNNNNNNYYTDGCLYLNLPKSIQSQGWVGLVAWLSQLAFPGERDPSFPQEKTSQVEQ